MATAHTKPTHCSNEARLVPGGATNKWRLQAAAAEMKVVGGDGDGGGGDDGGGGGGAAVPREVQATAGMAGW